MKKIAIITFGTYCDQKLTWILAKKFLESGVAVNYITNTPNNFFKTPVANLKISTYDLSKFLDINDKETANKDINLKAFLDVSKVKLLYYIHTTLRSVLLNAVKGCDYILIHYPALLVANALPANLKIKTGVFYVAPAYPNKTIPWIFSKEIDSFNFRNKKEYTSSTNTLMYMSLINGSLSYLDTFLKKSDVFAMWEKEILPLPKTDLKVKQIGSIVDTDPSAYTWDIIPETISKFLAVRGAKRVYISMGSFNLGNLVVPIIKALNKNGYVTLYHGKPNEAISKIKHENFFIHSTFLPHEWFIPKVDLIVTSGSLCMTAIANKFGKKFIYVPTLREQLFWAKNYKRNTGQRYVNGNSTLTSIFKQTERILSSMDKNVKLENFTKKLEAETASKDPVKILTCDILKKIGFRNGSKGSRKSN